MNPTITQSENILQRVTLIVQLLIAENHIYQERLNSQAMINLIYQVLHQSPGIDVAILTDDELKSRIDSVLMAHAVAGTLNDLPEEDLKIFNEIVGD